MGMNGVSGEYYASVAERYLRKDRTGKKAGEQKPEQSSRSDSASKETGLYKVSGRTVGEPMLSKTALKYYEELKKKYSNMEFILVEPRLKEEAEKNKGMFTSSKELLVLIDADKIERMAVDEAYRKKYEGILSEAAGRVEQMKNSLGKNGDQVSAIGMTFDDQGNAAYFAVVDRALELQRERIAEQKEEKLEQKKLEEKKAAREEKIIFADQSVQESVEESTEGSEVWKNEKAGLISGARKVTITADSWEELLKKIDELVFTERADSVISPAEKLVGQQVDFSV